MSDDYVHGINKMKKPATKVMAPPGGQTSINLFGGAEQPEPHRVNKCQASRNQSSIFGGPEPTPAPKQPTTQPAAQPAPPAAAAQTAKPSPPAEQAKPVANASKDISIGAQGQGTQSKPSTKVMAPPGGKSSICF